MEKHSKLFNARLVLEKVDTIAALGYKASEEQMQWIQHWKTHLAVAIIDDLGRGLADEITSIAQTILLYEEDE